jgi:hypothetical protein
MDVDPWVKDLIRSEADDEEGSSNEVASSPSGLSPDLRSSGSSLYDDGSQTFLSVAIINVDEDPAKNIKPLPVCGPILAMLPGPSVLRSLILIEEVDVLNDPWFIPPHYRGNETARPDVDPQEEVEVKEEPEGKVAGTLEFWAGDYLE